MNFASLTKWRALAKRMINSTCTSFTRLHGQTDGRRINQNMIPQRSSKETMGIFRFSCMLQTNAQSHNTLYHRVVRKF